MTQNRGRIVLVVLLGIVCASLWRTVSVERQKRQLAGSYQQAQQLIEQLQSEREQLSDHLVEVSRAVEGQVGDMSALQGELDNVQEQLDIAARELASLQRENQQLSREHAAATGQVSALEAERERLEARLSSLKELRLAMREVKHKIRSERWASVWGAWEALRASLQSKRTEDHLVSGNGGFVVKDGASTIGASGPRLHVHVLEPQVQ
ncbi:MAG: hypothetical protein HYT88_06990 [Candidatus Omnitrophica bacterium]|nr:hypothetical protein [Candidatus Omnitrophota bacterium]